MTKIPPIIPEMVGIHCIDPYGNADSPSRSYMKTSHLSQALTLVNPTEKIVQSGFEMELGKYTLFAGPNVDCRVVKVIPRYRSGVGKGSLKIPESPETLVVYENTDTGEYGCFTVPYYKSLHQYFGFKYKRTHKMEELSPGLYLNKNEILADSPAKGENGAYCFGTNLVTAAMSHRGVAEDGMVVSRDALDKLKFLVFEKRVVSFGKNSFPINLYGDDEHYKPAPGIGERTHDSGVLMAIRHYDIDNAPVLNSVKDCQEMDYTFDDLVYVREPNGKVVDLKVYHNQTNVTHLYDGMDGGLTEYIEALQQYYREILDLERKLYAKTKGHLKLEPELHRLIVEAYSNIDVDHGPAKMDLRVEKLYRKDPVDEFRMEFVIEYEITPTSSYKISNLHGHKGVICTIEEPENMPVDERGVRADIIIDSGSTVSRMNLGLLYEHYMTDACENTAMMIRDILGVRKASSVRQAKRALMDVHEDVINEAYDLYLEFLSLTMFTQHRHMSRITDIEHKREILSEITGFSLISLVKYNEMMYEDQVMAIENSKFRPPIGKVTFRNPDTGEIEVTEDDVRIAPMYYMVLEKIANQWLSVSSAKTNHFGIVTSITNTDRGKTPWRPNPVRVMGETEVRILMSVVGPEVVADMMDRNNNKDAHNAEYRAILEAKTPTNIYKTIDRRKIPYGMSRPIQIVDHSSFCAGWKLVYTDEDKVCTE